jgi:glutamyl-tRNA reductase
MNLLVVGCSHRSARVEVRERLAFNDEQLARAHKAFGARLDCETVILSTCNRVELYLGRVPDSPVAHPPAQRDPHQSGSPQCEAFDAAHAAEVLAEFHGLTPPDLEPYLFTHHHADAVRHLFRVAASLDSLIVGEGQIAGQVKTAFERARELGGAGTLMHALFRHAREAAKRVRTETGIAHGHVSVSSAAVDYVRQVFDHFDDKTILVIGAGKMGGLTLRHLRHLGPRQICVTNRSPEKAVAVAHGCGGEAVPWDKLDDLLARADIVLSTTGAPEPIVTRERWKPIRARRTGPLVILDIAVPRDFDPRIHDGDQTFLFNIDDLQRIRAVTLAARLEHVKPAEAIVEQEVHRFLGDWARRRNGPVIARLTQDFEAKRQEIERDLFGRLNGKISESDRKLIEGAFRLLQNRFLHGPITALAEESHTPSAAPHGHTLLDALRKLFRLHE